MDSPGHDVIVVGAGNAALCAALSAREHGASVVVLECAPEAEAGGSNRFAGGVMRFAFDGVDDLRKVADLTDEEVAGAGFGTYAAQYFDDIFRLTQYRSDPTLVELLVTRSLDTMIRLLLQAQGSAQHEHDRPPGRRADLGSARQEWQKAATVLGWKALVQGDLSMDLATVDHLLTTTRSVRRRLDLQRPVEPRIIQQCVEIAIQ